MTDHKFTDEMPDEAVIKALECCKKVSDEDHCTSCPFCGNRCVTRLLQNSANLINRQKVEIERLEYTLTGVMHSVDKWLDGSELKQDEVNRAVTMREKTLQIVEGLEEENEFLSSFDLDKIRAEAIKEFAERLKAEACYFGRAVAVETIDNLVKEMTGEKQ